MSNEGFCSVQDVAGLDELNVLKNVETDDINLRIIRTSMKIKAMANGLDLTGSTDAQYACIYGVLSSFQTLNGEVKVTGDQKVSSIKEGDMQINYSTSSLSSSTSPSSSKPSTYDDWFWFFMNKIIPSTPRPCPVFGTEDSDWM